MAATSVGKNHSTVSALQKRNLGKVLARRLVVLASLKDQGFTTKEAQYLLVKQFPQIRAAERWLVQHAPHCQLARQESVDLISIWNQIPEMNSFGKDYADKFPEFIASYATWRTVNKKAHPRVRKDRMAFVTYFFGGLNLQQKTFHSDAVPCFGLTGLSEQGFEETFRRYQNEGITGTEAAQQHLIRHVLDEFVVRQNFLTEVRGILGRALEATPQWVVALEGRFPRIKTMSEREREVVIQANLERHLAKSVSDIFAEEIAANLEFYDPGHSSQKPYQFVLRCLGRYDHQLYLLHYLREWFSL